MSDHPPHPQPPRPHVAPVVDDQRERFDAHEMALVLSHYDLGVIEHLRPFPRGSRRSPKLRIKSEHGEFLLKRRAPGLEDPYRVAFAHELQLHLQARGYPVPGLIGTRGENNSMLQLGGRVYEMFNYIHGTRYEKTAEQARLSGEALGTMHDSMREFVPQFTSTSASYHTSQDMDAKISLMSGAIFAVERSADRSAVLETCAFLQRAYRDASARVDEAGFRTWPRMVIHGDWHPGNLLYRDRAIVGVLDFDSARVEPRCIEIANALLQFSLRMDSADQPNDWPDGLEVPLIHAALAGYDELSGRPVLRDERASLPWLMIEALVSEMVVPIAATGSFARIAGSMFLAMVERKVRWIRDHAAELTA